LRQALGLIAEFLEGRNRPAENAQTLLQFGNVGGQLLRPACRRSRQRRPQPATRAK
jgi:hypothetical protein